MKDTVAVKKARSTLHWPLAISRWFVACEQAPEGARAGQYARILPNHQCLRPKFGRKVVIGGL